MPGGVALHDLIEALASSVTEAQDRVERFQISNLSRYFDENHRPLRVEMRVPSLRPAAEAAEEDIISVPLLAVIGSVRLAIKDVEISMEVDLGDLSSVEPGSDPNSTHPVKDAESPSQLRETGWGSRPQRKAVNVDVHSPRAAEKAAMAKVTLRVTSQEPTEGLARVLLELNKRIGPIALHDLNRTDNKQAKG